MKYLFILTFFLSAAVLANVQQEESLGYSFVSNLITKEGTLLRFTYKNNSNAAQCIRSADMSLQLLSDALYVISSTGDSIKYIGPVGRNIPIAAQNFIIIPPGEETTSSIRLEDFYKLKKGEVTVSYSIPVIPCNHLLEKYISMPLPVFMKSKISDPFVEKTKLYANDYPEWTEYGFIAVSKPLKLEF